MNKLAIFILLSIIAFVQSLAQNTSLLPVQENNKWGFIDTTGKLIVPLQYDNIRPLQGNRFCLIRNNEKEAVFDLQAGVFASSFHQQAYPLYKDYISVIENGLCGIELRDTTIVPIKYDFIRLDKFINGFVARNNRGTTIYKLDGSKGVYIPADSVKSFNSMYVAVNNGKTGLFSSDGVQLIPFDYDFTETYDRILYLRSYSGKTACVHPDGIVIMGKPDKDIVFISNPESRPLPFYYYKGEPGLYSIYNDSVLTFGRDNYNIEWTNGSGYLRISDKTKPLYGLADSTGKILLNVDYAGFSYLVPGVFRVGGTNQYRAYKINYGFLDDEEYQLINSFPLRLDNRYFLRFQKNNMYQIWNDSIPISDKWFSRISLANSSCFLVENSQGKNLLDLNGNFISETWFDSFDDNNPIGYILEKNKYFGLIDSTGTQLLPYEYNSIEIDGSTVRASRGNYVELYNYNNKSLVITAYTRSIPVLRINGNLNRTRMGRSINIPNYSMVFDSTANKYGIRNLSANSWAVPPRFDAIYTRPDTRLILLMNRCDSNNIEIGPLTFRAPFQYGLADELRGIVLFEPRFSMIFFHDLLPNRDEMDRKIHGYGTWGDFARAIDMDGNWCVLSFTGDSLTPNCDFIDYPRAGRFKTWNYDSLYIGKRNEGYRIQNVSRLYRSFNSFVFPANHYTDSIVKNGEKFYLLATNPDSLKLYRFCGGKTKSMGGTPFAKYEPGFMRYNYYGSFLERDWNNRYKNSSIYNKDVKYSFIDSTGHLIRDLEFTKVSSFSEGLACVKYGSKYGYIDTKGNTVIPFIFKKAEGFSEGLAPAKIKGRYGYINSDGEWAIEPIFYSAGEFSEGLAPVRIKSNWGYIGYDGNFLIEGKFKRCFPFVNGLAMVYIKKGYGLINTSGDIIVKANKDKILPPDENNMRIITKGKKQRVVDENGKFITKKHRKVYLAGDTCYGGQKGKKHILYNSNGKIIGKFESLDPLKIGSNLILTNYKLKYYYFTLEGDSALGPYDMAGPFRNNKAIVSLHRQTYIINTSGQVLRTLTLKGRIKEPSFDENMLAHIKSRSTYYIIDTNGRTIYKSSRRPQYLKNGYYIFYNNGREYLYNHTNKTHYSHSTWNDIKGFNDGYCIVKNSQLFGFTDSKGRYYMEPKYTSITVERPGIYRVTYGDRWGYIRYDGTVLWEVKE